MEMAARLAFMEAEGRGEETKHMTKI